MARKPKASADRVWRDRIVGEAMVPPGDLAPHPLNPRTHPASQARALEGLLQEVGWVQRVVVNRTTGRIVDGHLRVGVALERGEPTVPVVYVDLTEPEESLVLALLDPIAGLAGLNQEAMAELLGGLEVEDEALSAMARDLAGAPRGLTDPDAVPPVPEEAATWVTRGSVYSLGRHRLMCGDSTDAGDVGRLLGGARPALMVTDPPYGVEYDPTWRATAGVNKNRAKMGLVSNDDRADWTAAWRLSPADVAYVWHAALHADTVGRSLDAGGLTFRSQIVWAKDRLVLGRGNYHWRHELCWYGVRKGRPATWEGGRKQTTLWTFDHDPTLDDLLEVRSELLDGSTVWYIAARDDSGHGHSTQKPVEAMERPIRNHRGDVYEPFCGSGTTLIVERRFRYRKPLTCGANPEAHVVADLGHPYQSEGDG